MRTQASPKLDSNIALRLGMCAAALAGTAGMVSNAQATIVTFNTPIAVPNTFDGVYINFLTGATGTSGGATAGWDWNPYNSGAALSFFWSATPSQASGVAGSTTGPYSDLAAGATISGASTFAQVTAATATAAFQSAGTHYLGFRFWNEATSSINYGYATLNVTGTNGFPLTVTGWAFENSGAAITIPAAVVPEPATTAMFAVGALALGAANLRRIRRQRKAA